MRWLCGDRELACDGTPHLMGVVNVTPDSFSDGGQHFVREAAVSHAMRLVASGAGILDIGGESTRPGANPVPIEVEMSRVVPVIETLRRQTATLISIDTRNSVVAAAALAAGANIVNDVSALRYDPKMASVVAGSGAGVVLMHMRGEPRTMQSGDLRSDDIVRDILGLLRSRMRAAINAGIGEDTICVDPGLGFGKSVAQNYEIVARLAELHVLGRPLLLGPSRKSFIGAITGRAVSDREFGTAAACASAVVSGVDVLRVHDVSAMSQVVAVSTEIRENSRPRAG